MWLHEQEVISSTLI